LRAEAGVVSGSDFDLPAGMLFAELLEPRPEVFFKGFLSFRRSRPGMLPTGGAPAMIKPGRTRECHLVPVLTGWLSS